MDIKNTKREKTRIQINADVYDKENAAQFVELEYGLSLNQYLGMKVKELSKSYLNEETISYETQKLIDDAVSDKTDTTTYNSTDDLFKDQGLI